MSAVPSITHRVSRKASLLTESVIREMTREAMKYWMSRLSSKLLGDDHARQRRIKETGNR